jgi:hypothetical protein
MQRRKQVATLINGIACIFNRPSQSGKLMIRDSESQCFVLFRQAAKKRSQLWRFVIDLDLALTTAINVVPEAEKAMTEKRYDFSIRACSDTRKIRPRRLLFTNV